METWELIARESIRDLVARYNASGDSGRFDEMLALFAEDAALEIDGVAHEGRAAIRAIFEGAAARTGPAVAGPAFIRHFTASHQIDLEGPGAARGRCYFQVLTDRGVDHWGRYVDRYRLDGDLWRFARRSVSVDHAVPGGWAASAMADR